MKKRIAALLCLLLLTGPVLASERFDDVAPDAYYAEAVAWAVDQGITNGMGNRQFAPDQLCTIGTDTRDDINRRVVEQSGDIFLIAISLNQFDDQSQRSHRTGYLTGMMVAVRVVGRLFERITGGKVGDRSGPYFVLIGGGADGLNVNQTRILLHQLLQCLRQLRICIVMIKYISFHFLPSFLHYYTSLVSALQAMFPTKKEIYCP